MSAATDSLIAQADVEGAIAVFPVSAWIVHCDICGGEETVTARPGELSRRRVVSVGKAWMTAHRLICPGGPEKRSDRK
jgi:hypothetical protein